MPELPQFGALWVYLAASPLLGLTLTLCAYPVAQWIQLRCRACSPELGIQAVPA